MGNALPQSIQFLQSKGLFPDKVEDGSDDDFVMGDDDFPSADAVEEEVPAAAGNEEAEEEGDMEDPLAMLGGMGAEEVYKVTLIDEAPTEGAAAEAEQEAPA